MRPRWDSLTGIAFAALFVVGTALYGSAPGTGESDAEIRSFYADHGNQLKLQIAYLILTAAAVTFVWFLGVLYRRLRLTEGEAGWLSAIILVSGAAFVTLALVGFAAGDMAAATSDHTNRFELDPDIARLLYDVSYALTFETALPLAAPMVLAASLIAFRSSILPRWLGWFGLVVAAACVVGFLGVPMALFLIWIVAVAIVLLREAVPAAQA
jgi:hypothetical protein